MDDNELIGLILKHNDHNAFNSLVNKYQKLVVNTCRGFVTSYDDAADLSQDVFIELYESLSGFRNEAKLSTWLYRIAVNKSLNFIRKKKHAVSFPHLPRINDSPNQSSQPQVAADHRSDADFNLHSREQQRVLKWAISSLPENQRIAFLLNKYQDLSYRDVGEVMGISLSSVESLLFRAKANLQKKLSTFMDKSPT